jgi:hypothetical protein
MQNTAVQAGSADVSVIVRAFVASTGLPATTITNATSGLEIRTKRGATGAVTTVTPASLATQETAHADGGIIHLHGGAYRVDLPDAAVADGAPFVTITLAGVADTVFTVAQLALTGGDPLAAPMEVGDIIAAEKAELNTFERDIADGAGQLTLGSTVYDIVVTNGIIVSMTPAE